MPPYPQAVALQVLSAIAIAISLPPLALHWKNRNFPASCLICWYITTNLFNILNAFIWSTDDTENWWSGVGFCDVEVKVLVASYVGIPGTLACIFRSLAFVLDTRCATLVPTKRQRWKNRAVELMLCVFIPTLALLLHLFYQGNRYFIFAISGCVSGLHQSWASLALGYIWPLIICLVAACYCGVVLYRLHRYRSDFGDILRSANSGLSKSRFLRLFFLSFIMLMAIIPLQIFIVYKNIRSSTPWHPYSWSNLHSPEWSRIDKVQTNGKVFFDRWVPIVASFMLFISFGCGRDASKMYRSALRFLGLGRCASGVQVTSMDSLSPNHLNSSGSRARLVFSKYRKGKGRHRANDRAIAGPPNESNRDIEQGTAPSQQPDGPRRAFWLTNPLTWLSQLFSSSREHILSVPRLAGPSNAISTNAWASRSQSRGSLDSSYPPWRLDLIRVKQVIEQESKMQV